LVKKAASGEKFGTSRQASGVLQKLSGAHGSLAGDNLPVNAANSKMPLKASVERYERGESMETANDQTPNISPTAENRSSIRHLASGEEMLSV